MTEKWGTRRGFIKLHVGVDTKTKKIYAVVITDDKCGDTPQFEGLVEQAFANAEKSSNVSTPTILIKDPDKITFAVEIGIAC